MKPIRNISKPYLSSLFQLSPCLHQSSSSSPLFSLKKETEVQLSTFIYIIYIHTHMYVCIYIWYEDPRLTAIGSRFDKLVIYLGVY